MPIDWEFATSFEHGDVGNRHVCQHGWSQLSFTSHSWLFTFEWATSCPWELCMSMCVVSTAFNVLVARSPV